MLKGIIKTAMVYRYYIKFIMRLTIFICVLVFPLDSLSMALRKNKKETYVEVPGYSEVELMRFVQDQNIKAWKIMLIWLSGNAVAGLFYLMKS